MIYTISDRITNNLIQMVVTVNNQPLIELIRLITLNLILNQISNGLISLLWLKAAYTCCKDEK